IPFLSPMCFAKLSWSPSRLSRTHLKGTTAVEEVFFTTEKRLTNVTVRVVPELGRFVSTYPRTFSEIAPNQQYTLSVYVTVPNATSQQWISGTIQLTISPGNRVASPPLPITLTVVEPALE